MKKYLLLFICLCAGMISSICAQGTVYVTARDADVVNSPDKKQSVGKVTRGTELKYSIYKRDWYQVSNPKKGWVYRGKVGKTKPEDDPSLRAGSGSMLAADDVAASRGIRGVGPMAQDFAKKNNITERHKRYLDYHQSYIPTEKKSLAQPNTSSGITLVTITPEQLEQFMYDGKLGEYAVAEGVKYE